MKCEIALETSPPHLSMSLSCEEVGPQTRTSIAQALDGKEGHRDLLEAGHPQATPCTPKPAGDKLVAGQALLVELLHPSFPGGEDVPVSVRQEKANPERVGRPKPLKDACTGPPPRGPRAPPPSWTAGARVETPRPISRRLQKSLHLPYWATPSQNHFQPFPDLTF